jgi:oligopeptide/dipeptide ABC transporter ATP-binding protein
MPPRLDRMPTACRFQDRCERVQPRCREELPPLELIEPGRLVRCFFPVGT